jgi:recombination protein RecA
VLDLGVEMNIIDKKGAFYSVDGTRLGQGRENAREYLRQNSEMMDRLYAAIREKAGLHGAVPKSLEDAREEGDSDDEEEDDDNEESKK